MSDGICTFLPRDVDKHFRKKGAAERRRKRVGMLIEGACAEGGETKLLDKFFRQVPDVDLRRASSEGLLSDALELLFLSQISGGCYDLYFVSLFEPGNHY